MYQPSLIDIGNNRLEYLFLEKENKPLFIFINGAGRTFDDWRNVIHEIKESYSIFCYNRPGTGQSSKAIENQLPENVYALFESLINQVGLITINEIHIVTHSLGSSIAKMIAKEGKWNIKSITFLEPTTKDDVNYVLKHKMYIPQNTFSETDNIIDFINKTSDIKVDGIETKVIVGMKWKVNEIFNPYRRMHRKFITKFASDNNSQLVKAKNSLHFPQKTDIKIVVNELIMIGNSI